jgi:hypothetical protein
LREVLPESGPADDVALLLVRAVDRAGPSPMLRTRRRGLRARFSRGR